MLAGMILYRVLMRDRLTAFSEKRSDAIRKWFKKKTEPIRKKKMELKNKRRQVKIEKKEQKNLKRQKRKQRREEKKKE